MDEDVSAELDFVRVRMRDLRKALREHEKALGERLTEDSVSRL